jgi:hypothetical protein
MRRQYSDQKSKEKDKIDGAETQKEQRRKRKRMWFGQSVDKVSAGHVGHNDANEVKNIQPTPEKHLRTHKTHIHIHSDDRNPVSLFMWGAGVGGKIQTKTGGC